jgi:hypothetical protein
LRTRLCQRPVAGAGIGQQDGGVRPGRRVGST